MAIKVALPETIQNLITQIKTKLNLKQPKTLDSPITVDGTSQTTVEGALSAINSKQFGTASKKDVPTSGDASSSQVVMGNDTRLSDSRNAADVYSWAKASTKPSYSITEISGITKTTTDPGAGSSLATGKITLVYEN